MKILEVKSLQIPEIKVIKFARFSDHRGYFTEPFRKSDINNHPELDFLKEIEFLQTNESFSNKNTIRGLHFQWNPYMGKLVRTIQGRMVDLALDIRKNSPTSGKIISYDLTSNPSCDESEWIWVPPGFAHGNYFTTECTIEYFCSGEYSPNCEAGISPFSKELDWTLCDPELKKEFEQVSLKAIISDKDKQGLSLTEWFKDGRSKHFS